MGKIPSQTEFNFSCTLGDCGDYAEVRKNCDCKKRCYNEPKGLSCDGWSFLLWEKKGEFVGDGRPGAKYTGNLEKLWC